MYVYLLMQQTDGPHNARVLRVYSTEKQAEDQVWDLNQSCGLDMYYVDVHQIEPEVES